MKTELPDKEPDYWFDGDKMYCWKGDNEKVAKRIRLPLWIIRIIRDGYVNGRLYEKERIKKLLGL